MENQVDLELVRRLLQITVVALAITLVVLVSQTFFRRSWRAVWKKLGIINIWTKVLRRPYTLKQPTKSKDQL